MHSFDHELVRAFPGLISAIENSATLFPLLDIHHHRLSQSSRNLTVSALVFAVPAEVVLEIQAMGQRQAILGLRIQLLLSFSVIRYQLKSSLLYTATIFVEEMYLIWLWKKKMPSKK